MPQSRAIAPKQAAGDAAEQEESDGRIARMNSPASAPAPAPAPAPAMAAIAEAIARRDFPRLREMFDPDVEFRALTPGALHEAAGAAQTASLFAEWFSEGFAQEL